MNPDNLVCKSLRLIKKNFPEIELVTRIEAILYLKGRPISTKNLSEIPEIFGELLERGLWPRPGFKYGCRWRVYSNEISSQHAPWLIVPNSESPENWNEACLAARLAAGVNKSWLCAIKINEKISFIELCRWSPGKA